MTKLIPPLVAALLALSAQALAQNEGPCAFDFECGDIGKCVKAKPEDSIGACVVPEGAAVDEENEEPSASEPDTASRAERRSCRRDTQCNSGERCYRGAADARGFCAEIYVAEDGTVWEGRDRSGALIKNPTTCRSDAQCDDDARCFVSADGERGLCGPSGFVARGTGDDTTGKRGDACFFDSECGFGGRCYKERGKVRGRCGAEFKSQDGRIWDGLDNSGELATESESCIVDAECGRGNRCYKQAFESEGVCGPARRASDDHLPTREERERYADPNTWEGQQRRKRRENMEEVLGAECISNYTCGEGLKCQWSQGARRCVPE
jgi:hypothetical protein